MSVPINTIIGLDPASDSGTLGDNKTDAHVVQVTGVTSPGGYVVIHDVGTNTSTSLIIADGSGHFTDYVPLGSFFGAGVPIGPHTEYIIQQDGGGTVIATGANYTFTEVGPPSVPTIALSSASDSGTAGDNRTNVTTPTLSGTGIAGNTVTIYQGSASIGTTTVGSNGQWSFATSAVLPAGATAFHATQADVNGDVASSSTLSITIDTAIPSTPTSLALLPADNIGTAGNAITANPLPTFTGTAVANSTVSLYDGTTLVGTGTANGSGAFSIVATTSLTAGANSVTATDTSVAGNVSPASTALPVTFNTVPSGLTLSPASDSGTLLDNITDITTPVITGHAAAGDTVTLYDGTTAVGTSLVSNTGSWSITTSTLVVGSHTLTARQTDTSNNVSGASSSLTLAIAPAPAAPTTLTLAPSSDSGVAGDDITNVITPQITGAGIAGDTVTLYDGTTVVGTAVVGNTGSWSITTSTLAAGSHTLTATQTDTVGNMSAASNSLPLAINTTVPAAPTTLTLATSSDSGVMGDDITNVTTPQITGGGISGDIVTLYDGTTVVGTAVVSNTGSWSITTGTLAAGSHTLTASQTDVAGNVSAASSSLPLAINTTAPNLSAGLMSNPHNNNATVYNQLFAGSGDPGASVKVSDYGTIIGTAVVDATGAWSFDLAALAPGGHSLIASETNVAGNTRVSGATPLTVAASVQPDTRFSVATGSSATSGLFFGSDYTGSVGVLKAQYGYTGTDPVTVAAQVANTFMYGSDSGRTAIVAKAGSNVLAARGGSNWMVGANGGDGGNDTFFVNTPTSQTTWQTVLNFHIGDMLTMWDFNSATGSSSLVDGWGQPGYMGTTLKIDSGNGTGALGLVTFAGLSSSNAMFSVSTGSVGGHSYLAVTRTM